MRRDTYHEATILRDGRVAVADDGYMLGMRAARMFFGAIALLAFGAVVFLIAAGWFG